MKHINNYQKYNEGLKSKIAGAGLVGSLLSTPINLPAKNIQPIELQKPTRDVTLYRLVDKISISNRNESKDKKLNEILDEIKSHYKDDDSAKFLELYDKLATHLETHYKYIIEKKEIPSESSIGSIGPNLTLIEILGWLGSICLAICGLPQAWMSYKEKHSHGISWGFLLLWSFGECFALAYVANKLDAPLLLNYAANIGIVGVILYYKIKPKTSFEDFNQ